MRPLFLLLALVAGLLIGPAPARAEQRQAAMAGMPALSPAEAQRLIDLMTDARRREAFVADLRALTHAAGPAAAGEATRAVGSPGGLPAAAPEAAPAEVKRSDAAPAPAATAPAAPAVLAPATVPAAKPVAKPLVIVPLEPNSLGAEVLVGVTNFLAQASDEAVAAIGTVRSLPSFSRWIERIATDPHYQSRLIQTALRGTAILALSLAVERLLMRLLRGPLAALRVRADRRALREPEVVPPDVPVPDDLPPGADDAAEEAAEAAARAEADASAAAHAAASHPQAPGPDAPSRRRLLAVRPLVFLRRVPIALARLALDLVPVLAFLLVAHLAIASDLGGTRGTRLVLLALLDAYAVCRALMCVVRMVLAPDVTHMRLLPLSDGAAGYCERWARRMIALVVFGYAVGEAGLLFGMTYHAHRAYTKAVALLGHVFIAIVILQRRRTVRRWLRPKPEATGLVAALRRRFAATWHWMALFYDAALWIIWAVEIPDGYARLWRIFVGTVVVLALARAIVGAIFGVLENALRPRPGLSEKYPGLQDRLKIYQPFLRAGIFLVVGIFTLFGLLQSWGIGALVWLVTNPLGNQVLSAMVTLGVTLLVALTVWEGVNYAFNRELDRLSRQAQLARLARLRTLLPMLRTALLVTILIVVALMVLSEIGVNIAPLLAGAGVLGIAIGFGSQKLVQDVITGLFLLLENTMQVGDVVSLAGVSGVIENLSVRTLRLRAEDGSVHVIPFSAVTTVTNLTRDFSHAVVNVAIGYRDDYEQAVGIMQDIVTEMRREPRWMGEIRDDLEVWGLDRLTDAGVQIKCRIRCGPFGRWAVGREFNRRLLPRFLAAGIYLARQGYADDPVLAPPLTIARVPVPPVTPEGPAPAPRGG